MGCIKLTPNEEAAIQRTRQRIVRLGTFFANNKPPTTDTASEWIDYLAMFKDELGNLNNDMSFVATLLARSFLSKLWTSYRSMLLPKPKEHRV